VSPGPRILVTGAAGFLGAAVVREFAAAGARVRALTRTPAAAADLLATIDGKGAPIELVIGSLGQHHTETDAVAGCDIVVHAAGALRGAPSTLVRYNVIATRRLVRAATQHGVRRFLLVSSLGVYDTSQLRPGDVLDESCAIDRAAALRPYIYSKIVQEQVCWEAHCAGALPLVVVRPGVIFGPGRRCLTDRVGPRLGRWVAVIGPRRPLPYTFVQNCARAVALAATAPLALEGEAFNIVDDELPTGRDIVRRCRRAGTLVRSLAVPSICAPLLSRAFDPLYRWSDGMLPAVFLPQVSDALYKPLRFSNERAKRRLNWKPAVDLETAFDLTFGFAQ
jgi:nucleoside-diphosphate-sugar epimerase